jgi:hypothetical protein
MESGKLKPGEETMIHRKKAANLCGLLPCFFEE